MANEVQFETGMFLRIFPAIMLPMFLAIVDQTIVASSLSSISATFGSPERVSWVIIAYLVAATIAAPVSGTLGDAFGRRRMMVLALLIFLAAALLCATAQSMEALVASRILQGLGGGALATASHALIGETVPPRERGRYQGYIASVVVTASTAGPVIGGLLTAYFGWRSIFIAEVPLVLIALLLARRLPAISATTREWHLDTIGLLLFVLFVASSLVALEGVRTSPLDWPPASIALLLFATFFLMALIKYERRLAAPLIPLAMLRVPAIRIGYSTAFCHGAALVALVALVPIYARVMLGLSVEQSAMMLLPLTGSIGIGSFVAGRMVTRTGHTALLPSICLSVVTAVLLLVVTLADSLDAMAFVVILTALGVGMGPTMAVVQITVQVSTGRDSLGVAAGFVQFSRSIGAAFGTALTTTALFASAAVQETGGSNLLGALIATGGPLPDTSVMQIAANSFRAAFLMITVFAVAGTALSWLQPLRKI